MNETSQMHQTSLGKCLAITQNFKLTLERCDESAKGQKWQLENMVHSRLKGF
jgi:hypothetical protein